VRPAAFAHLVPRTVDEAVAALADAGDDAKVLAGGQSLVPLLALRLARPTLLVDVTRVAGLSGIAVDPDGWLCVGAATRQRTVERSPLVAERCPLLAEAVPLIAHAAIRSQGTVGGSLCHADPAAELPLVALAAGAELVAEGPRHGRAIPAREFFTGFLETALAPDEVLVSVRLPPMPPATGTAVVELARRHGDFAVAAVAAVVGPGRLDVWVGGVAPVPVALDVDPGESLPAAAAADAAAGLRLSDDVHGTAPWRRRVVERLVVDAVTLARARARAVPS